MSGWLRTPLPRIHKIVLPLISRLIGPVECHYVIEQLIPLFQDHYVARTIPTFFSFLFLWRYIYFYSLFFLSISFLSRLIVANSEYLYFRCTGFNIIFYCSLVNHISGITYVESTGRQLLVYEHVLGKASFLVLFLKHILIKLKKFK